MNQKEFYDKKDEDTGLISVLPSVLVTGASGFLGSHLVTHLSKGGKKIRALYFKNKPSKELLQLPKVEWVQCDLLDIFEVEEVMIGIDQIFHCAAIVSFQSSDHERLLHFNVNSTTNIINEAILQGVNKIVFVSSVAALGRSEHIKEITEEAQWEESKYNSRYAKAKHLAEMEVWRGVGEGLSAVIINPGIILGEGNWKQGSSALVQLVDDEFPFFTQGVNSFVDVLDVVSIMDLLMGMEANGERYIVSAGNYSYKEIFSLMAKELNKRPPHIRAGKLLTGVVWRWNSIKSRFTGRPSTITKETARTSQKQSYYNNEKLKTMLPDFQYTPLEVSIKRIVNKFLEEQRSKK